MNLPNGQYESSNKLRRHAQRAELSFFLRDWKDHERAEWRFSIRETSGDIRRYFSNFTGLLRFLADLLEEDANETGGDDQQNQSNEEANAS